MDDLIADFVAECREMLEALGGEIVAWEAQPDDRARLDSIFRFVHTVKGNCGFFEFPRLEALSHAAEDALADCRAGRRQPDGALVSAVLAVIDRISEMVSAIEAGEDMPTGDDNHLIDALAPGAEGAAAPVATAAEAATRASSAPRTIRLSVELLDRVMSTVSDMVLARNELARRLRESANDVPVDGAFERLSSIIAEMRDAITRTRMQRIENLFVGLPRMVRDLSAELGKQVLVDIDGGDVELDREMIEMIRDPLTHIIRNAVDHGIEKPADFTLSQGAAFRSAFDAVVDRIADDVDERIAHHLDHLAIEFDVGSLDLELHRFADFGGRIAHHARQSGEQRIDLLHPRPRHRVAHLRHCQRQAVERGFDRRIDILVAHAAREFVTRQHHVGHARHHAVEQIGR